MLKRVRGGTQHGRSSGTGLILKHLAALKVKHSSGTSMISGRIPTTKTMRTEPTADPPSLAATGTQPTSAVLRPITHRKHAKHNTTRSTAPLSTPATGLSREAATTSAAPLDKAVNS